LTIGGPSVLRDNVKTTHRDLEVWKEGIALAKLVYEESRHLPKDELFGLTSQMRRAAVSVPSNVAEGAARGTLKEFRHYLFVSRGSLAELETLTIIAHNAGYLSEEAKVGLRQQISYVSSLLQGLLSSLARKQ
jgi:four helix bundle protein